MGSIDLILCTLGNGPFAGKKPRRVVKKLVRIVAVLAAIVATPAVAVYKCKSPNGIIYQQTACATGDQAIVGSDNHARDAVRHELAGQDTVRQQAEDAAERIEDQKRRNVIASRPPAYPGSPDENALQRFDEEVARKWAERAARAKRADDERIAAFIERLKYALKDSGSAQFRNLRLVKDKSVLCGEVNARNSYGGLTGYSPFVVDSEYAGIAEHTDSLPGMIALMALRSAGCI